MNFEKAVEFVLSEEGGYVNNARDPGGETKFGISRRSYPLLDIANLAASDAIGIYRTDFWDKCRCGELPRGVDFLVFDAAVNQGQTAAIQLLQKCAGTAVDGVMGPKTLAAAKTVTVAEYAARRMDLYARSRNFDYFGFGWSRRLMRAVILAAKDQ